MSLFPHENPLPVPDFIVTPVFETLLASIKNEVFSYFELHAPVELDAIKETLENEAELLTKFTEAITSIIQSHFRKMNEQAKQMFGMYATDNAMIDLIASQLNVQRLVLDEGDPNAFPVVPPTMESNHDLLTRYYLAAYSLASTGTRGGYRFHALTLGGRPSVNIDSSQHNKVVVTYEFKENELAGNTKDAQARQVSPGVVDCYILSHEGSGLPSGELINATQIYMSSDEIAQETDLLTVKKGTIKPWNCVADVYISSAPDPQLIKESVIKAVQQYADKQHRLDADIEPSMLYNIILAGTGAFKANLTKPAQPILCDFKEAPYLESIQINIITDGL